MRLRLRLWLFAMDVIAWCGGFGSRAYLYAVSRAGECVDYGDELREPNNEEW